MSREQPTDKTVATTRPSAVARPRLAPVPPHVTDTIERHCFSTLEAEVGGVLLGRFEPDGATAVRATLPALAADGASAHVTFTHEVWEQILPVVDTDYPGMRIVGWYHTHPGFGLFLSEQDQFTHRNFFSDPRMLALVVDPKAGEAGWFGYAGEELVEVERSRTGLAGVKASPAAVAAAAVTERRNLKATAALIALVLAAAGVGIGYAIAPGNSSSNATAVSTSAQQQIDTLTRERDAAAAAQAEVRRQLDALRNQKQPTTAPSPAPTAPAKPITYRVRQGDTLSDLAVAFYGDPAKVSVLARANRISDPNVLSVGQVLSIPAG
jgi:proteasome lid subunit RPN8/RPN11/LysM repeat protein